MFQPDLTFPVQAKPAVLDPALLLRKVELEPFASWVEVETRCQQTIVKQDLLSQLGPVLQRFGQERYPRADRAATVSQWSTDYLCATLIPLIGFAVLAHARTQDPNRALYRLQGPAIKAQIVERELIPITDLTPDEYVSGYLLASESAFLRALAKTGHVSERLLWTNLAVVVDAICAYLSGYPEHDRPVRTLRNRLFSMQIPGHKSLLNDLLQEHPVPDKDLPAPWLVRRICCLHYRLDEQAPLCINCPLLLRKPLHEQAAYLRSELS